MLRIITQIADAQAELRRVCDRTHDATVFEKEATVREVLQTVRQEGDRALLRYTEQFDGVSLTAAQLRVSGAELDAAYQQVSQSFLEAIRLAQRQIRAFHEMRIPKSWVHFGEAGKSGPKAGPKSGAEAGKTGGSVVLGKRYTPVDRAGLYVPGGKAAYPSTVLMNAIPAIVAGVARPVVVTPPGRDGTINPAVLVAAQEAGVREIYRVGGAQAIAALAYGTETIPKVDVITGPGNVYVTLAKKLVYGTVGIDSLAGPSEVLIIADRTANPTYVAADMLAQAEHDQMAAAILLTDDTVIARKVVEELGRQLEDHPRREMTQQAIDRYGLVIVVESLAHAAELSNGFAPEHLELEIAEPWDLIPKIRHAGAIFIGSSTPEAIGDYLAGPNHTLPTSGAARYASALSVETFMKHSSLIEYSPEALMSVASAVDVLAQTEGLHSHGESVRLRQRGGLLKD
jgi:histidinol dehydrogenase